MASFIRNKSAEKDIRNWLSSNGYDGKTARFDEAELHAIMRPGWLQVFRFELTCLTDTEQRVKLFGAMRSDDRYGPPAIVAHQDIEPRDSQLDQWSDGLITQRRHRR